MIFSIVYHDLWPAPERLAHKIREDIRVLQADDPIELARVGQIVSEYNGCTYAIRDGVLIFSYVGGPLYTL